MKIFDYLSTNQLSVGRSVGAAIALFFSVSRHALRSRRSRSLLLLLTHSLTQYSCVFITHSPVCFLLGYFVDNIAAERTDARSCWTAALVCVPCGGVGSRSAGCPVTFCVSAPSIVVVSVCLRRCFVLVFRRRNAAVPYIHTVAARML